MVKLRDLLIIVTFVFPGLVEASSSDAVNASDIDVNKVGSPYLKGLEASSNASDHNVDSFDGVIYQKN